MTDEPGSKDLKAVLARLQDKWQELAHLLISRQQSPEGVMEVQKILLQDASGQYRGKISANADGSAGLLLSDPEGKAWVWLGINQDGEAFLELKDKNGELSFKVAAGLASASGAEPAAGLIAGPGFKPLEPPGAASPTGPPDYVEPEPGPGDAASAGLGPQSPISARLEKLERQHQGQRFFRVLILVALGLILATQAIMLVRPQPKPPVAGEAVVGSHPGGEPGSTVRDNRGQPGKTAPNSDGEAGKPTNPAGGVAGQPEAAVAGPSTGSPTAVTPGQEAEAEVRFVGSITSNRYHYPTCKLARTIRPERLITFKSAAAAQERHYRPCPLCKPPPLSP